MKIRVVIFQEGKAGPVDDWEIDREEADEDSIEEVAEEIKNMLFDMVLGLPK